MEIKEMLRMCLHKTRFNLTDSAAEDSVCDSCGMRKFTGTDFINAH